MFKKVNRVSTELGKIIIPKKPDFTMLRNSEIGESVADICTDLKMNSANK